MAIQDIPNVDFSIIPDGYEGKWLLVQVGESQKVVAVGDSPKAVMESRPDLEGDPFIVLTKVPVCSTALPTPSPPEPPDA